jgi:hypothetical protein
MKDIDSEVKVDALIQAVNRGDRAIDDIPDLVEDVIDSRAWTGRQKGRDTEETFDSFREFCTTAPSHGLGCEVDRLRNLCRDRPEVVKKIDKATKANHGGKRNPEGKNQHSEGDKFDNIKLDQNEGEEKNASTGTSKSYTLQRLERDAPELYEKVVADEMSANAAAIEAGFRTKTVSVPVHKGGEMQIQRAAESLANHFDSNLSDLITALQQYQGAGQ